MKIFNRNSETGCIGGQYIDPIAKLAHQSLIYYDFTSRFAKSVAWKSTPPLPRSYSGARVCSAREGREEGSKGMDTAV